MTHHYFRNKILRALITHYNVIKKRPLRTFVASDLHTHGEKDYLDALVELGLLEKVTAVFEIPKNKARRETIGYRLKSKKGTS